MPAERVEALRHGAGTRAENHRARRRRGHVVLDVRRPATGGVLDVDEARDPGVRRVGGSHDDLGAGPAPNAVGEEAELVLVPVRVREHQPAHGVPVREQVRHRRPERRGGTRDHHCVGRPEPRVRRASARPAPAEGQRRLVSVRAPDARDRRCPAGTVGDQEPGGRVGE